MDQKIKDDEQKMVDKFEKWVMLNYNLFCFLKVNKKVCK